MALKSLEEDSLNNPHQDTLGNNFSDLASAAVKKVLREELESKTVEDVKSPALNVDVGVLGNTGEFLRSQLYSMGHYVVCMKNIVANSKRMPAYERKAYAQMIIALTTGYKSVFGPEFGSLLVVGVTSVAKDLRSTRKHFDSFTDFLYSKAGVYNEALEKQMKIADRISSKLKVSESSKLRFFKKKKIARLRKSLSRKITKTATLQTKKSKYAKLADSLKHTADPYALRR